MIGRLLSTIALWFSAPLAHATPVTLNTQDWGEGQGLDMGQIVGNVLSVGTLSITYVCTAVFIVGALLFSTSAGDEKRKSTGKDLMVGAVIGVAVVAGARGIFKIVYMFLYG